MDPYRHALVRSQARALVAEREKSPRGVRVRAWTDGTTELRIRDPISRAFALVWLAGALGCLGTLPQLRGAAVFFAFVCTTMAVSLFKLDEHLVVTPAAVSFRRGWRRRVCARADIRRIEIARERRGWRLALDDGTNAMTIGAAYSQHEPTLQWIAERLQRALEDAQ